MTRVLLTAARSVFAQIQIESDFGDVMFFFFFYGKEAIVYGKVRLELAMSQSPGVGLG